MPAPKVVPPQHNSSLFSNGRFPDLTQQTYSPYPLRRLHSTGFDTSPHQCEALYTEMAQGVPRIHRVHFAPSRTSGHKKQTSRIGRVTQGKLEHPRKKLNDVRQFWFGGDLLPSNFACLIRAHQALIFTCWCGPRRSHKRHPTPANQRRQASRTTHSPTTLRSATPRRPKHGNG